MPCQVPPTTADPEHDRPGNPVHLSRRDFLAGVALGGAALASGCSRQPGSRGNAGGWYAWMSDVHLATDPKVKVHGQVMADNLRAVIDDVLGADDPPRGLVINGDLAYRDGQPSDYRTLLNAVEPLRHGGIPLHLALGNHDDRDHFRAALGDPVESDPSGLTQCVGEVEGPGIRMLLLDSLNGTRAVGGQLGEAQRAWLAARLDAHPETPTVVFVHHNLNAQWVSALHDTDALLDVLRPRRQAKAVVFGHTHVFNARRLGDLHAINLPAVGYRFSPKQPLGWCLFRPGPDGGELELRCVSGNRRQHRRRIDLRWRSA
ncbi:MAG: metallophosphoesterase [Isosphaeraceae bacterium]